MSPFSPSTASNRTNHQRLEAGAGGLSCASIKATAAIRGIDGERTQAQPVMLLAQGLAYGDQVIDVIVEVEPVARKGRVRESGPPVM